MYKKFEKEAEKILSKMTLQEKIGQLNQITITPFTDNMEKLYTLIENGGVGSIILASSATAGNDPQGHVKTELYDSLQKIAVEKSRLGIPMIYGRDVIHGHRTVYPVPLASAAAFNDELLEKCYGNIAAEAAADGIRWTFSPMLDMCHDPRWGRVVEGPGEDPFVGASMARACVKGFQGKKLTDKSSLVACAKHYIGYGASEGGRDYFRAEISDATLQNYYLPAFRAAVDAGVGTVMSSFNDISGSPVSGSKKYLTDILRGQLNFEGFVVSDWGAVVQLEHHGLAENSADCAAKAINAGVDLDMCDNCYSEHLENLVKSGEVSEQTVNTAVRRILTVKLAMGLFENPYSRKVTYNAAKHTEDARALAGESMVLLKNNGVLPLNKKQKIGLFGPFCYERRSLLGAWTLDGDESATKNFYEAVCDEIGAENVIGKSCTELYDDVHYFANMADTVVLALGESHWTTGENHSVSDISLSKSQVDLIRKMKSTGKKVVGVFFCGRPMALGNVADDLDAVLYAWHCGSETAAAAADIIFGNTVPSGKTPITFPKLPTHLPLYYNITSSGHPVNGYYGEGAVYNYTDSIATPLYPFGYGLSYTTFKYSGLKVNKKEISLENILNGEEFKVSINLKNTGNYNGKETVQLYIRDVAASVIRPIRELKAYKKVFLKKGEQTTVEFSLGYNNLGFYNENGEYLLEKGGFEIYVGENCLTANKTEVAVK